MMLQDVIRQGFAGSDGGLVRLVAEGITHLSAEDANVGECLVGGYEQLNRKDSVAAPSCANVPEHRKPPQLLHADLAARSVVLQH